MGFLRDILDTLKEIKNTLPGGISIGDKKYSSIAKRSAEGTFQFPVLVSRSLDIDTLQMVSKALERQYSSFAQTVITMSPIANVKDGGDTISDYLKQFHQNTGTKTDRNDVFDGMKNLSKVVRDNYSCFINEDESIIFFSALTEGATKKILDENKDLIKDVFEGLNLSPLNNKFRPEMSRTYVFENENLSAFYNNKKYDVVRENDETSENTKVRQQFEREKFEHQKKMDTIRATSLKDKDAYINDRVLKDNDVKKSNELVPTTLHIRVLLKDTESGNSLGYQDFIMGIKTIMHPIRSDEVITNLVAACQNNNKVFDFIRWTTGETSFFKDFLFNMKEIKDDVVNRSEGSSQWWITLKRRKLLSNIKKNMFLPGQLLPNTTIVVSMEEIEYIKTNYGFDLMNPNFVDKVMDRFFLLGFVVVDVSTQIVHFLFDGQMDFQSVTFNGLERENSAKLDTKEVLKLINKS